MKIIKGDLILKENFKIEEDLRVEGDIKYKNGFWNIDAGNIDAGDISYYACAFANRSFKCKSIIGKRENHTHFCLDSEIEFKNSNEYCKSCGHKLK